MSEDSQNHVPESLHPEAPPVTPGQQVPSTPTHAKEMTDKKLIAGILGIVLGAFGVHKFYLGYQKEGIIMLIVGLIGLLLCGIPTSAVAIVGLVEGILYLTKTDDEFVRTYVIGRKPWF